MTTTLAAFLGELSDTQKAITALIGAASFGAVCAIGFLGFVKLPAAVEQIRLEVVANTEWRHDHSREFQNLICIITLPDSVASDSRARTRECGV